MPPTSQAQRDRQKQRREARMSEGYSSNCAHGMHAGCALEGCPCRCHTDPQDAAKRSAAAEQAWETRRAGKAPSTRSTPAETPPKRPEIKSGVKAAVPAAAARQIKSEIAFLTWAADQGVGAWRPDLWAPADHLAEAELAALTNATYNELEARAPWLLKWLATAQQSAPEAALLYTLAMIAVPRLARREAVVFGIKITPELARAIATAPLLITTREPAAASVGAESAPVDHRPNGHGQIDVGGASAAGAAVPPGPAIQAGLGELLHRESDQNGTRNGRYEA